jgi:hypothetical protein
MSVVAVLIGTGTVLALMALLVLAWWLDLGQARLDAAMDNHAGNAPRGEDY